MHFFNSKFHKHRLAGARIPFYPEKSLRIFHPSSILWIFEKPITSVLCDVDVVVSVLLFRERE